jgi:hypothetical protein
MMMRWQLFYGLGLLGENLKVGTPQQWWVVPAANKRD